MFDADDSGYGGTISIVSGQTLWKFGLDMSNVQPVEIDSLRSVTGEKMFLFGRIVFELRIANRNFFQSFWIADMNEECVSVCNFLEQHGRCLDMTSKCIIIDGMRSTLIGPFERLLSFSMLSSGRDAGYVRRATY